MIRVHGSAYFSEVRIATSTPTETLGISQTDIGTFRFHIQPRTPRSLVIQHEVHSGHKRLYVAGHPGDQFKVRRRNATSTIDITSSHTVPSSGNTTVETKIAPAVGDVVFLENATNSTRNGSERTVVDGSGKIVVHYLVDSNSARPLAFFESHKVAVHGSGFVSGMTAEYWDWSTKTLEPAGNVVVRDASTAFFTLPTIGTTSAPPYSAARRITVHLRHPVSDERSDGVTIVYLLNPQ